MDSPRTNAAASPRSTASAQPGSHKTPREMQLVMCQHIQAMSQDINSRWPQVDPELMCLLWICEKRKLHPPTAKMDLWRRDLVNTRDFSAPTSPTSQRPTSANSVASPRRKFVSPTPAPEPAPAPTSAPDLPGVARRVPEQEAPPQASETSGAGKWFLPTKSGIVDRFDGLYSVSRDDAPEKLSEGPLPATAKAFSQKDVHWRSAMSTAAATDLVSVEERSPHVQKEPKKESRWMWRDDDRRATRGTSMLVNIPSRPDSQSTRYASPTPADRLTAASSPEPWSGVPEMESPYALAIAEGRDPKEDYCRTPPDARHSPCLTNRLLAIRDTASRNKGGHYLRTATTVTERLIEDSVKHSRELDPRRDIKSFEARLAGTRNLVRGRFIRNVPLLSREVLSEDEQFWVTSKAMPVHYKAGDVIVEEGSSGDDLYIVEQGTCVISKSVKGEDRRICDLKTGEHFGELAVMYDMPRAATVTAQTTFVKLLKLSREDIFSIVGAEHVENMKFEGRLQLFGSIPLFRYLDRATLKQMIKAMRIDNWDCGKAIVSAGDRYTLDGRRLYFLEQGVCEVTQGKIEMKKTPNPGERTQRKSKRASMLTAKFMSIQTGRTGVGHTFGMFELVYNCPQMTTVQTLSPVVTLSINYTELQEAVGDKADHLFDVMRRALRIQLLRQSHASLSDCAEEELTHLIEATGGFKKYQPWEVIVRKGQRLEGLLLLEEGECLGNELSVETLMDCRSESVDSAEHNRPGDTFGTRNTARDPNVKATFSLIATSVCSILHIPRHYFLEIDACSAIRRSKSQSESPGDKKD